MKVVLSTIKQTNKQIEYSEEEFEDTKGVIRIVFGRRIDNTMAKGKSTKGQTTFQFHGTFYDNVHKNTTLSKQLQNPIEKL